MKIRKLLWAVLYISLLLLLPDVVHRIYAENNNNTVLLACKISCNAGNINTSNINKLKAAGIPAAIIPCEELINKNGVETTKLALLDELVSNGFDMIFQFGNLSQTDEYYNNLAFLIGRYDVRYLLAYPGNNYGIPSTGENAFNIKPLLNIIKERGLITFLMENKEQTGHYNIPGLDRLIASSGYRVNRAFSISSSLLGNTGLKDPVPVWLRAVTDRNVRLVAADLHELDAKSQVGENKTYNASIHPMQELKYLLYEKGFNNFNTPIKAMSKDLPGAVHYTLLFINLAAAIALYISYLPKRKNSDSAAKPLKMVITIVFLAIIIYAGLAVYIEKGILIAFAAAITYPSLAGLLIMIYLRSPSAEKAGYFKKTTFILGIMLLCCITGGIIVTASMSDVRYIMHLINFNLVTPAYVVPLMLFAITFAVFHKPVLGDNNIRKYFSGPDVIKTIIYVILLAAILYVYLARNGNSGLIYASGLELKARDMLEAWLYTRPRTKEFMIGYPCLFLFAYFYRAEHPALISFTTGLLSIITGVSILNSFCHGYTPVLTSSARTGEGLLLGLFSGLLSVSFTAFIIRARQRNEKVR